MSMPMPQPDYSDTMERMKLARDKYGDDVVIKAYSNQFPRHAEAVGKFTQQFGSAAALDEVLGFMQDSVTAQTPPPAVPEPVAEPIVAPKPSTPSKFKQVMTSPTTLTGMLTSPYGQRDIASGIQKFMPAAEAIANAPGIKHLDILERKRQKFVKNTIAKNRKQRGQLPDLYDLAGVVKNEEFDTLRPGPTASEPIVESFMRLPIGDWKQNKETMQKLALDGKFPRKIDILKQFGPEYGNELIREVEDLPGGERFFAPESSWQWAGEINRTLPFEWIRKHPTLAKVDWALTGTHKLLIDELTDPKEWMLDFVAGKWVVVPAIKALKRTNAFRRPVSGIARRLFTKGPRQMRRALGSDLIDAGVSKKIINQLDNLTDDELRAIADAARQGKEVSIQLPQELTTRPSKWTKAVPEEEAAEVAEAVERLAAPEELVGADVPTQRVSQIAATTGLSDDTVLFWRSQGLNDDEIIERSIRELAPEYAREAPVALGDNVQAVRWGVDGKVVEELDADSVMVQLENGLKVKITRSEVVPTGELSPPPIKRIATPETKLAPEQPSKITKESSVKRVLPSQDTPSDITLGYNRISRQDPKQLTAEPNLFTARHKGIRVGTVNAMERLRDARVPPIIKEATDGAYLVFRSPALAPDEFVIVPRFGLDLMESVRVPGALVELYDIPPASAFPLRKGRFNIEIPAIVKRVGDDFRIETRGRIVEAGEGIMPPPPIKRVATPETKLAPEIPPFDDVPLGVPPAKIMDGDAAVIVGNPNAGIVQVTDTAKPNTVKAVTETGREITVPRDAIKSVSVPEGPTQFDILRAGQATEMAALKVKQGEAGFVRFRRGVRKVRTAGQAVSVTEMTPKNRMKAISEDVTGSQQYADDMLAYSKMTGTLAGLRDKFDSVRRGVSEIIRARGNSELMQAAVSKKSLYPDNVKGQTRRTVDNIRTQLDTYGRRGEGEAHMELANIWGNLDKSELSDLEMMIQTKGHASRSAKGLPQMSGATTEQYNAMFDLQYGNTTPSTQEAFEKFRLYMESFTLESLVKRGHLDIEDLFDFYVSQEALEHLYNGKLSKYYLPKRLKKRFRPYLQEARGTEKPVVSNLESIVNYIAAVKADNATDDFVIKELSQMDAVVRKAIKAEVGEDGLAKIIKGLRLGKTYPMPSGAAYKATQFEPGNYLFQGLIADDDLVARGVEEALLEENAEKILASLSGMSTKQQKEAMLAYVKNVGPKGGDALRRGIILGKAKPKYLVPVELERKLRNFKTSTDYIPLMREAMGLTSFWKRQTLYIAGVPYHVTNIVGDTMNMEMTAPGSGKYIPSSARILGSLKELQKTPRTGLDQYDLAKMPPTTFGLGSKKLLEYELTDFEKEGLQIVLDGDVLGAGFLREFTTYSPRLTPKNLKERYLQASGFRESLDRVALTLYEWGLHKQGKPFEAIQLEKHLKYLTPQQTAAYIGRNALIDYADIPGWYKKYVTGLLFPFMTFTQKNTINWGKLAVKGYKRPVRWGVGIVAPMVAIKAWNEGVGNAPGMPSGKRRKAAYDKLPHYFKKNPYTFVQRVRDENKDGVDDTVDVWAPRTTIQESAELVGIDELIPLVDAVRAGAMTKKEAAEKWVKLVVGAPGKRLREMVAPAIQIIDGIAHNKDPYDGSPVYDPTRTPDDPGTYLDIAEYTLAKMNTFFMHLSKGPRGGRKSWGPHYLPEYFRRVAGIGRHYTFNIPRALGFHTVDISGAVTREIKDEVAEQEVNEKAIMRGVINEYIYGDINDPEEFAVGLLADAVQINRVPGFQPKTGAGKRLADGHDKGLFVGPEAMDAGVDEDLSDYPIDAGYLTERLRSKLYQPWVHSVRLTKQFKNRDISPWTGKNLTDEEEAKLNSMIAQLNAEQLNLTLQSTPIAIRPVVIQQVKRILGLKE